MTTVRFGLTAVAPGQAIGQPWNAFWVGMSDWQGYDRPTDDLSMRIEINPISFNSVVLWAGVSPIGLGLVTALLWGSPQDSEENFTLNATWNSIKDIEFAQLDTHYLNVTGFVDTWIAAAGDDASRSIMITGGKRGAVDLGNGNDTVTVNYLSNEYTSSNHFHVGVGNGNDNIDIQPAYPFSINATPLPAGWTFNTEPDRTNVGITLGGGVDMVSLKECSGTITAGAGTDTFSLIDGHNALILGSGTATVTIAAYNTAVPAPFALATDRASDIVQLGSGHADITIDDTMTFKTPQTTILVGRGQTGAESTQGTDDIRYGHVTGSTFAGGDWSALDFEFVGYDAGSSATLTQAGDHTKLIIKDSVGGAMDTLNLYGAPPTGVAAPHLYFT